MNKKVKNRYLFILIFILLMKTVPGFSSNPLDTNWRDYVYDKQAWELGAVSGLLSDGEELFVTGFFTQRFFDSLHFNGIAELQDTLWVPLGSGDTAGVKGPFPVVIDMIKKDSILYVAGIFDTAGCVKAGNIAYWNTNARSWSSIGGNYGAHGEVTSLAMNGNKLFIGGNFDYVSNSSNTFFFDNIMSWNGSQWDSLGPGLNGSVNDMFFSGNELYVVGTFDSVGTARSNGIAIWNDSTASWTTFGNAGPAGEIINVCKVENHVYVSGIFDHVNTGSSTISCTNIASWDGSNWDSLGSGIDGFIHQLDTDGSALFVAGDFTKTINDTLSCKNIARWDSTGWFLFGSGANEEIRGITLKGDSVLVGGSFSFTGDTLATHIGLWYEIPPNPSPKIKPEFADNGQNLFIDAYPNPATDKATLKFSVLERGNVNIRLIDLSGKPIETILEKPYSPGVYSVIWDTGNLSTGLYLCEIQNGSHRAKIKIMIMK